MKKYLFVLLALGLVCGFQSMSVAEEVVENQVIEEVADDNMMAADAVVEDGMMAAEETAGEAEEVTEEMAEDMMAAIEMYEGTVSAVDAEAGKVVISYVSDPETAIAVDADFWVKENSMLMNGDQAITAADVKAGDKVAFAFDVNEEGGQVLSHLHVISQE